MRYYLKYNGIGHVEAAAAILKQAGIVARIEEFNKFYPLLTAHGRASTYNAEGKEVVRIACSCETCKKDPQKSEEAVAFDRIFSREFHRIKELLNSIPDYQEKVKLWIREGLHPCFKYSENEDDVISIAPDHPSQNPQYNSVAYRYLLDTEVAFTRELGLPARIAKFESQMSRALYPDQCLKDAIVTLQKRYPRTLNLRSHQTFNDLVAGKTIDWQTTTWSYNFAYAIAEGQEAYLFLRYLETYSSHSLGDYFPTYAGAIFGEEEKGMQWSDIAAFFANNATNFNVKIPYINSDFPQDGSIQTKFAGIVQNLQAMPKEVLYKVLIELAEQHSSVPGAMEFAKRIETRFGPLSRMYSGVSHDLINDVLTGLGVYPKAAHAFKIGLKSIEEANDLRSALDNLRVSIELLLKELLQNTKSLENQRASLDAYLNSKNVPAPFRNSFWELIELYSKYHNGHVKHDIKVELADVNTILYLTVVFVHRLLKTLI